MQCEELVKRKIDLQNAILREVSRLVTSFREETGFSPNDIRIEMLDVTSMADIMREVVIARVEVDISI